MKKIAIFGSTGMTGLCALEAAVNSGLDVTALVRNPSNVPEQYKNQIKILQGDVLVAYDVEKTIEGNDGVVVALGTRNDLSPTTVMSEGLKNILAAMKKHNVDKISVCLSAFLFYEPEKVPPIFTDINADHQRMLDALRAEKELNWIAVLPPHIASVPSTEHTVLHDKSPGRAVSKHDLGAFLVNALDQPEHYRQICGIASVVKSG